MDPHVRPINELVDSLREPDRWMPYVAPDHGGVNARVLSVLRDPGKGTYIEGGSGFLSVENNDDTAEAMSLRFAGAGIEISDVTPWNAYPWFIDRTPTTAEIRAGVMPLLDVAKMLTNLQVVLLHGTHAQLAWRHLARHTDLTRTLGLTVIETYHPSRQALFTKDPTERVRRIAHRDAAYPLVREALDRRLEP